MAIDKKPDFSTVIIGSGPAGLTAAIYLARAGIKPVVLSGNRLGGQLGMAAKVENFPGFPEGIPGGQLMLRMRQQAERFGVEIVLVQAKKIIAAKSFESGKDQDQAGFVVVTDKEEIRAQAIIIATGASARWLGVPGEKRWRGRGVSFCATCDGPFFRDKVVAVIGGGNTALTEALFLARLARQVFLIHRREHYRAEKILQERLRQEKKIIPLFNTQVKEFLGQERLTHLRLESRLVVETGEYQEEIARYPDQYGDQKSGRSARNLVPDQSFQWQLAVDGAFVAIGHRPNTAFLKGFLELDEKGYIKTKNEVFTSIEGVFAAGDCVDYRYQQAVTAAAMGCKAALETERFLSNLKSQKSKVKSASKK